MDNSKVTKSIPIIFQKLNTFEVDDTRFIKVKIWLMHLGENLNGSYFSKEVVEDAIPTLNNTPILAYIEDNSDGEKDFSDHRMVLVREEGNFKVKYIGQAIGVIPETNNAQFEMRLCDDGIEREFLTVEGLVWQNKWDDAPDILNRDLIKAESMEIHDDYEGQFEDDNLFHFSKFKFYGACGLGKSVLPAMQNATIEVQFSYEGFNKEIQTKMEQFKLFSIQNQSSTLEVDNINNSAKEGGIDIVNEQMELLKKYNLTPEQLNFNIEDLSIEELEIKVKEHFSLTAQQFKEELINELMVEKIKDDWGWEYSKYSYVDHIDNVVFAYDRSENWKLYGFEFVVNGDKIEINFDSKKRKKFEIVDFEEGISTEFELFPQEAIDYSVNVKEKETENKFNENIEKLNNQINEFAKENSDLKDFKSNVEQAQKDAFEKQQIEQKAELVEVFSKVLTADEIKVVQDKDLSAEDMEKEFKLLYADKEISSKFNKKPKKTETEIPITFTKKVNSDSWTSCIKKNNNIIN